MTVKTSEPKTSETKTSETKTSVTSLSSPRWAPENLATLNAHLDRWREDGVKRSAVFDFDNTCIFHDAGEAVLREQLRAFDFRMAPEVFAEHLPTGVNGTRELHAGHALEDLRADLVADYRLLWPHRLSARSVDDGIPKERADTLHNFSARLGALYFGLEELPAVGARFAYPWVCGLLAGFDDDAVEALAVRAWNASNVEPIGKDAWTSSSGNAPAITFRFSTGLRIHAEIRELQLALVAANVTPYIVTASEQGLIRAIATAIGFPIHRENIFGMRLALDDGDVRRHLIDDDFALTYRDGKRQTIESFIGSGDKAPVLIAGDSDTDFEMLSAFGATEVRVIIHRNHTGSIATLYDDDKTLLQGRNNALGCFHPHRHSS